VRALKLSPCNIRSPHSVVRTVRSLELEWFAGVDSVEDKTMNAVFVGNIL
jgi:hypothetical protein